MKLKYIFMLLGVGVLIGAVSQIFLGKKTEPTKSITAALSPAAGSGDDMASHHAPAAPVDNTKFQALLGQEAPDFALQDYSGKTVKLSDYRGKNVILFFNEGAMCYPSCWDQISAFNEDRKLKGQGAVALSIVVDTQKEWKDVIRQMPKLENAEVLFDSDRKIANEYGVLTLASSMHRGQFPGHTYVIVGKDGLVKFLADDEKMGVRNTELLAELGKI